MAVRTKEEILEEIREAVPEESDALVTILEDVSDTLDDFGDSDGEDWKAKYEENDRAWKKKYTDRFFNKEEKEDPKEDSDEEEETKEVKTYEDLFEEKEEV